MSAAAAKLATVLAGARKIHPDFSAGETAEDPQTGKEFGVVALVITAHIDEDTDVPAALQALRETYREGMNRISNLLGTIWRRRNSKQWWRIVAHTGTGGQSEPTVTLLEMVHEGKTTTITVDDLRTYWTRKGWDD